MLVFGSCGLDEAVCCSGAGCYVGCGGVGEDGDCLEWSFGEALLVGLGLDVEASCELFEAYDFGHPLLGGGDCVV